jgi:hypothetical protein
VLASTIRTKIPKLKTIQDSPGEARHDLSILFQRGIHPDQHAVTLSDNTICDVHTVTEMTVAVVPWQVNHRLIALSRILDDALLTRCGIIIATCGVAKAEFGHAKSERVPFWNSLFLHDVIAYWKPCWTEPLLWTMKYEYRPKKAGRCYNRMKQHLRPPISVANNRGQVGMNH